MRGGMRNAMPEQPADVRNKNFQEVALGYTKEMAVDEAQRCLNCPKTALQAAARLILIFLSLSMRWHRKTLPRPIKSLSKRVPCPLSADVSARRKTSARVSACWASRASL